MERERVQRINGWRMIAVIAIMIIAIAVACVTGLYFMWRSEAHLALRQGRNIWSALRLIGMDYYGKGINMYNYHTRSGLKEEAEERVRELTGCEGEIMVLEHTDEEIVPTKMVYREDQYIVYFYLDDQGERQWEVYRIDPLFDLDGAEKESFGA